jgi:hypothetical protein
MIVRRCSQGHDVQIYKNTNPTATRIRTFPNGTTLTYPSSYDYFVKVDGEILKKSNSFKVVEEFYVSECAKKHDNGHGRIIHGKHKLEGGVVKIL